MTPGRYVKRSGIQKYQKEEKETEKYNIHKIEESI